ncbi:aldehyde dehydrogenase PuuC [Pokkaliibacter plantistimulans]|uniref:Aldehyde dehydrogenase PuuC n=1 Tax=Proteobacteria bacterium 228 TaxID=2083153 RepID=A0A2S5KHC6_9PROT|nr:aldehyde dehydrogenase [Pokkaliibacter plantistimulans]PPC73993.1 aldehyde dehydrogenase PuuC [Pokkaliibacter plantistimulans]
MATKTRADWQTLAQSIALPTQAFIDGRFVDAISGQTFTRTNPANGQPLVNIASCDSNDVDLAVAAARRAFNSGEWSELAPKARKAILLRWVELIREHKEELALLETLDTGKPIAETLRVDAPSCAEAIAWYAEAIDKIYDEVAPNGPSTVALVSREPVGVVAGVVPWNYPLIISGWKIGPALAAGNAFILKPAEQSTLGALKLAELARLAGIPDGIFQVVTGLGPTAGQALGLHPDVDAVVFTGSTEVGKKFLEYSARSNMKRVGLECGGKSPHIVSASCSDLDKAAMYVAYGIWYNQGETCNAGSRLIVDHRVKDQLLAKVKEWAAKLQPGDPLDPATTMGALIEQQHMQRVLDYVRIGQEEGAEVILGGEAVRTDSGGYFVPPTILDNVRNGMRVAQEEIFGPVLVVITCDGLEEAIAIANESQYGLAAAVWTDSMSEGHKAARKLRAGTVWVNCFDHTSINAPFGGYKQSGQGRDKSLHAFDKYTELKTTWIEL